jgi:hypothetical protein
MTLIDLISRTVACPETGCWLWTGATSGDPKPGKTGRGYPRVWHNGRSYPVHRLVLKLLGFRMTKRHQGDHQCVRRLCIRPEHLERTTHKENMKRRDERRLACQ